MGRPPYYLTAYALAVKHGFKGTEEEWLESLHGAGGARGPEGPQGPQGPQGAPGEPGTLIIHTQGNEAELAPVGVLKAVEKGQNVVLLYGDLRLTLVHVDENSAVFTAVADGQMTAKVVMDTDGMLSRQTFQLASKEDANAAIEATKAYYINIVEDEDENLVADKTFNDIRTHYYNGASLYAKYNRIVLPLHGEYRSDRSYVFEGTVNDNEHYRFTVYGDQSVDGVRKVLATEKMLDGKIDIFWGAENKGKTFVIGDDGRVILKTNSDLSGGLSAKEKNLLISLFKNIAYTADMSDTIAKLESLWSVTGGGSASATGGENVVVTGATATDDGNGNVTINGAVATDDGNGNITVS